MFVGSLQEQMKQQTLLELCAAETLTMGSGGEGDDNEKGEGARRSGATILESSPTRPLRCLSASRARPTMRRATSQSLSLTALSERAKNKATLAVASSTLGQRQDT